MSWYRDFGDAWIERVAAFVRFLYGLLKGGGYSNGDVRLLLVNLRQYTATSLEVCSARLWEIPNMKGFVGLAWSSAVAPAPSPTNRGGTFPRRRIQPSSSYQP